MKSRKNKICLVVLVVALLSFTAMPGQSDAQAQQAANTQTQATTPGQTGSQEQGSQSSPLYRVTVEARTTKAINYSHAKGSTPIDFKGTVLMPFAKGEAMVEGI
jgi:Tfp pilus assembly protein PilV